LYFCIYNYCFEQIQSDLTIRTYKTTIMQTSYITIPAYSQTLIITPWQGGKVISGKIAAGEKLESDKKRNKMQQLS